MTHFQDNKNGQKGISTHPKGKVDWFINYLLHRINSRLKLRIKGKLTIAFVGFSAIPILIIGTLLWFMTVKSMRYSALQELSYLSELINIRLNEFTETVHTDIQLLNAGFLSAQDSEAGGRRMVDQVEVLQRQVYTLMRTKPRYFRLTFLVDSLRSQLFCYQRDLTQLDRVFPTQSNYSWAYYRLMVANLSGDQMRLTPVEHLDVTSGETLASFSFALPQRSPDGRLMGIFIADIFAYKIFSLIETTLAREPKYTAGIVDREGHFLYHSVKKQDWNRLLAESSIRTLEIEFSEEIATKITDQTSGMLLTEKGDVIYHIPLAMGSLGLNQDYYFYLLEPGTVIFAPLRKFGLIFVLSMLGFVVIALYLSRLATLQFVRPITKLQQGSDIIAQGNFDHRLQIDSGDEIEELAEKYNYMAGSIAERDQKLHEVNTYLEQKVQERTRELQDEKNKLQIILDNVPSAFVLLSSDQTVLTASSALKLLTGYHPQAAIGKKCFEVLGSKEACEHCEAKYLRRDRIITRREYQVSGEDGELKTFELVNIPVRLTSGEDACLEILSDITSRVRLQNQLMQSEKLASIGEMAAVIAHEIRNSLTSANMLLQLVHESEKLDGSEKESLEVVLSSINRINEITRDLLAFARSVPIQKEEVDLSEILRETFYLYKHHLVQHRIRYQIDLPDHLPVALIDHNLMQEVFGNILLNACQAIQKDGTIQVQASVVPLDPQLRNRISQVDNNWYEPTPGVSMTKEVFQIQFLDDGPGIPAEKLDKVFDPFYTTKINGTGLGLSMARRVIEAHGGFIQALSAPGQGTTINIVLPIESNNQ